MKSLRLRRASASALRCWRASRRAFRSGSSGLSAVSDRVSVPAPGSSPPNSSLRILSMILASLACDAYGDPARHPITSGGSYFKRHSPQLPPLPEGTRPSALTLTDPPPPTPPPPAERGGGFFPFPLGAGGRGGGE